VSEPPPQLPVDISKKDIGDSVDIVYPLVRPKYALPDTSMNALEEIVTL
jgi:hypothetical protein